MNTLPLKYIHRKININIPVETIYPWRESTVSSFKIVVQSHTRVVEGHIAGGGLVVVHGRPCGVAVGRPPVRLLEGAIVVHIGIRLVPLHELLFLSLCPVSVEEIKILLS